MWVAARNTGVIALFGQLATANALASSSESKSPTSISMPALRIRIVYFIPNKSVVPLTRVKESSQTFSESPVLSGRVAGLPRGNTPSQKGILDLGRC